MSFTAFTLAFGWLPVPGLPALMPFLKTGPEIAQESLNVLPKGVVWTSHPMPPTPIMHHHLLSTICLSPNGLGACGLLVTYALTEQPFGKYTVDA